VRPLHPDRVELLYDLSCSFGAQLELDELIPSVITRCREVLGAEGASVLLLDETTNELFFPYVSERDPRIEQQLASMRFPATEGIAGAVLQSGKPRRVGDAAADGHFYDKIDAQTGVRTREILAAPLKAKRGVVGVLEVINPLGAGSFTDDDLTFLEALAGSVAVAIENARLHGELKAREERLRTEIGTLRRDIARRDTFTEIVGTSDGMREVFRLMESAASSTIAVLVEGETGTGKELVARGIHEASDRADGPFVAVNIAALSGDLLESELFGHARGAFTGAIKDRVGLFEAADRGTILLDEISELPRPMQVKLLRVLQEGEVTPVGTTDARKVDVRVISASNVDVHAAAESGAFREDLYFRISAFPITLPPLRSRREDIPLLVDRFVAAAAKRHGKRIVGVDPAAFDVLCSYDWPGNIRQLENEIERVVALTPDGGSVSERTISPRVRDGARDPDGNAARNAGRTAPQDPAAGAAHEARAPERLVALREARAAFESEYIREALSRSGGNVTRTARALGVSRVTLQKKLRELGLR
jgi:Nif-specific regulatory protein